jgi:hypothetical protein
MHRGDTVRSNFRTHRGAFANARAASSRSREQFPVVTSRVHPAAWVAALQLARGDRRRLRVVDDRTVIVINHPGR